MLAVEAAQYIDRKGLGTFDETGVTGDVFIATLPDKPDNCVAVYPRPGSRDDGTPNAYPALQIIVRSAKGNPTPGGQLAQDILDAFRDFNSASLTEGGNHVVHCKSMQGQPAYLKTDDNNRHEWSINLQFMISR